MSDAALSVRVRGACHGFDVRSDLPICLTRDADPERPMPPLYVRQAPAVLAEPTGPPVLEWVPGPGRPLAGRLHTLPDGYGMWIDGLGSYQVDPSLPMITAPADLPPARWEFRLWGVPAALCFIARGDLSLHAAAIDTGGAALLLVGPGRFGKTTLAAAFLQAGYRTLAEDLCRCTLDPVPAVYPGPPILRIRRDSYARLKEFPGTHVVMEEDDRIHLAIDSSSMRGGGEPVPLGAIVTLQTWSGPATFERLDPTVAIPLLWATSLNLPEHADRARCFLGVSGLAGSVPVWRLSRRLEYSGLPHLVDRIVTTCMVRE